MSKYAQILEEILKQDKRYDREAYFFVNEVLRYIQEQMSERRHIDGKELLEGIRRYALEQYGPLSKEVFNHWGVRTCEDFGEIVFNLVDHELLGKTEQDRREDFSGGYDFKSAFEDPFLSLGDN